MDAYGRPRRKAHAVNRILIKPKKRWYSSRQQWTFELQGGNYAQVDPRDTVYNREELITTLRRFFDADAGEPVELIVQDARGVVEKRIMLRR